MFKGKNGGGRGGGSSEAPDLCILFESLSLETEGEDIIGWERGIDQ